MKSNLVDVDVILHHETEKAWLVSADDDKDEKVWIAKSIGELEITKANKAVLSLPEWAAMEKGLM